MLCALKMLTLKMFESVCKLLALVALIAIWFRSDQKQPVFNSNIHCRYFQREKKQNSILANFASEAPVSAQEGACSAVAPFYKY